MEQQFQDSEKKKYLGNKQNINIPIPRFPASKSSLRTPADIKQSDVFFSRGNLPSGGRDTTGIISIEAVIICLSGHQPCAIRL
jgi:hypothetical protein